MTTMIRPQMEYAETVWPPRKKKHVDQLEGIQKMATNLRPELAGLQYQDRLREINLTTLEQNGNKMDVTVNENCY